MDQDGIREQRFEQKIGNMNRRRGNILAGLLLLIVGGVLLARQMDYHFPSWLFSWEMLVIVIGVFIGAKSNFRDFGWMIVSGIGLIFLFDDIWPEAYNYIWPAVIIIVGLVLILRPVRKKSSDVIVPGDAYREDILDVTAVFGAVKKIVLSKNFRGGEAVSVFGGSEINLSQADFTDPVKVEVVAVFGGIKMVVPSNWEIRSEAAAIFGGVEDKREQKPGTVPDKVLILDGVAIFGGIEITSF
jgi:predicted membrane protein